MAHLNGQVAVVTGAANGIGAATVRRLASLGAKVVMADVDEVNGRALAQELGAGCCFKRLDVSQLAAHETLYAETVAEFGRLDIVHLNAGVLTRGADHPAPNDPVLPHLTEANLRRIEAINLDGVVFGTIAALPHLGAGDGGQIVVTSSRSSLGPSAIDPYYGLSKAAVNSWTISMAAVLADRSIRVNGVIPGGGVDTAMFRPQWRDRTDFRDIPLLTPGSIAEGVVALMQRDEGTGVVYLVTASGELIALDLGAEFPA